MNNFGAETNPGRYYNNLPSGSNQLNLNHIYARIYGTTATYEIGRQPIHWGLGALINDGANVKTRFSSIRDGVTVKIKLGKFSIEPFVAKVVLPLIPYLQNQIKVKLVELYYSARSSLR